MTKALSVLDYNPNNVVFSSVKDENNAYKGKRITLSSKHPDGSVGDLVFKTNRLSSIGVKEFRDVTTGKVSHSFTLFLWNKNGASDDEKLWSDKFASIINHVKSYLLTNKKELKLARLEQTHFGSFSPLKQRVDEETGDPIGGPCLYPKIWASYDNETNDIKKMYTRFFNEETNEPLNMYDLVGSRCVVRGAIKLESIYISSNMTCYLNMKLIEARVTLVDQMTTQLLTPDTSPVRHSEHTERTERGSPMLSAGDDDFTDDEDVRVEVEMPKKKAVARKR